MYEIIEKKELVYRVYLIKIKAPQIAKIVKPGQFVILTIEKNNNKIPLTVCDYNCIEGTFSVVVQALGKLSNTIINLKKGDTLIGLDGPLGKFPDFIYEDMKNLKKKNFLFVAEELGVFAVYSQIRWLRENGVDVYVIINGRSKENIILDEEIRELGAIVYICIDDGSYDSKGSIIDKISELIQKENKYNEIITVATVINMMRFIVRISDHLNVEDIISLNDLMFDGSGLFGACKVKLIK